MNDQDQTATPASAEPHTEPQPSPEQVPAENIEETPEAGMMRVYLDGFAQGLEQRITAVMNRIADQLRNRMDAMDLEMQAMAGKAQGYRSGVYQPGGEYRHVPPGNTPSILLNFKPRGVYASEIVGPQSQGVAHAALPIGTTVIEHEAKIDPAAEGTIDANHKAFKAAAMEVLATMAQDIVDRQLASPQHMTELVREALDYYFPLEPIDLSGLSEGQRVMLQSIQRSSPFLGQTERLTREQLNERLGPMTIPGEPVPEKMMFWNGPDQPPAGTGQASHILPDPAAAKPMVHEPITLAIDNAPGNTATLSAVALIRYPDNRIEQLPFNKSIPLDRLGGPERSADKARRTFEMFRAELVSEIRGKLANLKIMLPNEHAEALEKATVADDSLHAVIAPKPAAEVAPEARTTHINTAMRSHFSGATRLAPAPDIRTLGWSYRPGEKAFAAQVVGKVLGPDDQDLGTVSAVITIPLVKIKGVARPNRRAILQEARLRLYSDFVKVVEELTGIPSDTTAQMLHPLALSDDPVIHWPS